MGLMDYFNIRLGPSDPNRSRYGFNQKTDSKETCSGIQRTIGPERFIRGEREMLPVSTCVSWDDRLLAANTCGDGVLDPWEECDAVSNACCSQCKLKSGATCGTNNTDCCVNCTTQGPKRCAMPYDTSAKLTGVCGTGGYCTPSECSTFNNFAGNACPDDAFFPSQAVQKCGYACPSADCKTLSATTRTNFDTGSACVTSNGAAGLCVDTEPFNVRQSTTPTTGRCVPNDEVTYSWKNVVIAQCDCKLNLDLIDTNVCINTAGRVVASSYCAAETKPTRPTCCCNPPCAQDSLIVGGGPNAAMGIGVVGLVALVAIVAILFV